ncbi:hypothetical protein ACE1SV_62550 [Streptomyces sp. E-15]
MGSALPMVVTVRESAEAGAVSGSRLHIAPHIISARGAHGDVSASLGSRPEVEVGLLADRESEILRAVRGEARLGADWIKFGGTGGFYSPSDSPDQVTYTRREMETLVGVADDLGLPCAVHAFGDEGALWAVRAGVRFVEHGSLAKPAPLAAMEERGTFLVPTTTVLFRALKALDDDEFWQERPPRARQKFRSYGDALREGANALARKRCEDRLWRGRGCAAARGQPARLGDDGGERRPSAPRPEGGDQHGGGAAAAAHGDTATGSLACSAQRVRSSCGGTRWARRKGARHGGRRLLHT